MNNDILHDYIIDEIFDKVDGRWSGNKSEIRGFCPNPEHDNTRTRSFSFNVDKMIGYCHSENCGHDGVIHLSHLNEWLDLNLNLDIKKCPTIDKVKLIKKLVNRKKTIPKNEYEINYSVSGRYKHTDDSINYLKSRGFDSDFLINSFNVGGGKVRCPDGLYHNCVTIPVYMHGKCKLLVHRIIDENSKYRYMNAPAGFKRNDKIWGIDYINGDESNIIICEGIFNSLSWIAMGFKSISILGSYVDKDMFKYFGSFPILNFDLDKSGYKCYNLFNRCYNKPFHVLKMNNDANYYYSRGMGDFMVAEVEKSLSNINWGIDNYVI